MIGILLAGGAATRLPNKPLLPQRNGKPVCLSGLDYLFRHGVEYVNVVVPPSSVIVDVIASHYHSEKLNFIYQAEPSGVGDAINLALQDDSLIVAADNIYPREEVFKLPKRFNRTVAVLRQVEAWRIPHLVRMGLNGNLTRSGPGVLALTSPWYVSKYFHFSSEGWPDFNEGSFIELPSAGWWDIGTPETYSAYWRNKEEAA